MPVRSSRTSVLKWPDAQMVDRVGDVDLIIVVRGSEALDLRQAAGFDATSLQVPADVQVDTLTP